MGVRQMEEEGENGACGLDLSPGPSPQGRGDGEAVSVDMAGTKMGVRQKEE
jgi:hypothetical protein